MRAIGEPERATVAKALSIKDGAFTPKRAPGPDDWLADTWAKDRKGQTFMQFYTAKKRAPTRGRNTIYLLPLGIFDHKEEHSASTGPALRAPDPATLTACVEAWFGGVRVATLPPMRSTRHLKQRIGEEGQVQLHCGDIHEHLKKVKPPDAFCVVGYTMVDLYPRESWNFCFGQARADTGTGIFSFARYTHCKSTTHFLRRCCSVLVHEIGHLFGLAHCVWYECNMNGSNHDEESDRRPMHLCPVELHKLYHSLGGKLDIHLRDQRLAEFFESVGLIDDANWYKARAAFISSLPQEKSIKKKSVVVAKKAVVVAKKPLVVAKKAKKDPAPKKQVPVGSKAANPGFKVAHEKVESMSAGYGGL